MRRRRELRALNTPATEPELQPDTTSAAMDALGRLRLTAVGTAAALAAFLAVGAVGVHNYALNYWFYRGFSPPR